MTGADAGEPSQRSTSSRVTDARLGLPGDWWAIPLRDERARHRSVTALVDRQFAGLDDQPLLKRRSREDLIRNADDAAGAHGRLLALSLQRVDGVPVPASMTLHWLDLGPAPDGGHLASRHASPPPPTTARDTSVVQAGPVTREVRVTDGPTDTAAEGTRSLRASYWLDVPEGTGLVHLAFSTPLVDHRDAMLALFDAITETLRWVQD